MKKQRTWILLAAILLLLAVAGTVTGLIIANNRGSLTASCKLYFLNSTATALHAETRDIKYADTTELPVKILEQLGKGPSSAQKQRILPDDVKINVVSFSDNRRLTVDLSKNFLSDDKTGDMMRIYGIVKTLCENGALYNVEQVQITVEGAPAVNSEGREIGFLSASDINLSADKETGQTKTLTLYFLTSDGTALMPEQRKVKLSAQQSEAQYIVSELIKGPVTAGLSPVLEYDTSLVSVQTVNHICFINFKAPLRAESNGDNSREQASLYAIVNSLTELNDVEGIQILINGKKTDRFGSLDISDVLRRNEGLIRKENQ